MEPIHKQMVGWNLIEEFDWGREMVVYINNERSYETFDHAVERLEKEFSHA